MKAITKKYAKEGLWIDDVPVPEIGDHDVLIHPIKTSICGTDMHIYNWDDWAQKNVPVPLVVGHEFVGEIVKVGKHVHDLMVGQRVSGEGHLTCGKCPLCRTGRKHLCPNTRGVGYHVHGCFAEFFPLPAENVFPLPDSISNDVAAIFDPYGNTVHTAMSFPLTAESVLITGAGPIGIMAAGIAKQAGAKDIVITDVNDYRLDLAKQMGATRTVNVSQEKLRDVVKQLGIKYGFTVGLEMSGHPDGLRSMLETAQNGASIALLGILPKDCQIDWDLVIFKMLTIKGIYGREIFKTWYQMSHLLEGGLDLNPVITHKFAADDFEMGFEAMKSGQCGKVILEWT